jgi:hypothetical protein
VFNTLKDSSDVKRLSCCVFGYKATEVPAAPLASRVELLKWQRISLFFEDFCESFF